MTTLASPDLPTGSPDPPAQRDAASANGLEGHISLRTRTYRSILRGARAKGISEEAIRDCVFAFMGENPDADELRAALRDYVPTEDERDAVARKARNR